jgi:hypothetical protein
VPSDTEAASSAPARGPRGGIGRVLKEGLVAGLAAGLLAAAVHLACDLRAGQPLRTAELLGELLFAAQAAPGSDLWLRFSGIHFSVWLALGVLTAGLVSWVDAHPRLGLLVFGSVAFVFLSLLQASGAFSVPDLPALQLWLGTLAGAAALSAVLARRHPDLLQSIETPRLTATARRDLLAALSAERSSLGLYEQAARMAPEQVDLDSLCEAGRARVEQLLRVCEQLDVTPDPPETDGPLPSVTRLADIRPLAIAAEERKIAMYDRFLVSIGEGVLHTLFLELAAGSQDRLMPLIAGGFDGPPAGLRQADED